MTMVNSGLKGLTTVKDNVKSSHFKNIVKVYVAMNCPAFFVRNMPVHVSILVYIAGVY